MLNEENELYRKLQLELYWCWNFFQEDLIILKMSDQLKSVRHPFVLFQAIDLQLIVVVLPGLEPGQTGPESVVLPLHHKTVWDCKSSQFSENKKISVKNLFLQVPE